MKIRINRNLCFINEGVSMKVGLITKRSDKVEMICGMEELMNFVH